MEFLPSNILIMEHMYNVSEVCLILQVSKSSLFRWEKDNKISKPTKKESNGYREYSLQDIMDIASAICIKELDIRYVNGI